MALMTTWATKAPSKPMTQGGRRRLRSQAADLRHRAGSLPAATIASAVAVVTERSPGAAFSTGTSIAVQPGIQRLLAVGAIRTSRRDERRRPSAVADDGELPLADRFERASFDALIGASVSHVRERADGIVEGDRTAG
jgi:hypothetical protein